jgi:hypothetical protein
MKRLALAFAVLAMLGSVPANATALSAADVRILISMMGLNPGTVRLIKTRGLHQLLQVKVTGKRGRFVIRLVEREVR